MKISLAVGVGIAGLTAALGLNSCGGGGGESGTPAACEAPRLAEPSRSIATPLPRTSHCATSTVAASDPLYLNQWHLRNTGQAGGSMCEDVNVEPVWNLAQPLLGTGMRIAIVDDGLEIAHEDLAPNVVVGGSWNYVNSSTDPTGGSHGTAVAGVAAARDNNLGVRGAAPRASLVGYNLLAAQSDTNEAEAMTRDRVANEISSNSWGAPDDNGTLDAPAPTWYDAIDRGLAEGRDSKGLIYVWAGGNGGRTVDNSNYDGQANYRGVIAICAVGDDGKKADYSENGANLLVCAPSLGRANHGITTTDRTGDLPNDYDPGNYTSTFSGTSSAAPLAAGVIALVLEANPNLGWRDVRQVIAKSARQNDPTDVDWQTNAAGIKVNHKYGFGVIDANAAVTLASGWTNITNPVTPFSQTRAVNVAIPDGAGQTAPAFGCSVSDSITVAGSGIGKIEFVEVIFTSNHPYSGDLEVVLSKSGSVSSRLAEAHACKGPCGAGYANGWRFGDIRHMDEAADGTWTLQVRDGLAQDVGTFVSWTLRIYGRAG